MIKVTEDTAFQYYQVTAVENGVITTTDGGSFHYQKPVFHNPCGGRELLFQSKPEELDVVRSLSLGIFSQGAGLSSISPSGALMYWSYKGNVESLITDCLCFV